MMGTLSRRNFLLASMLGAGAWGLSKPVLAATEDHDFQISLNELSLQRALSSGRLDHLDLAKTARTRFDVAAIEYASRFFRERVHDEKYLIEMNKRAADQDVRQLLIMVDSEGRLGDPNAHLRKEAVRDHHKWVDAAKALGCHSIEVSTAGTGTLDERLARVAEGIRAICEYADQRHINVLVGCRDEQTADARWLLRVIEQVGHPVCGALPTLAAVAASENEKDVAKLLPLAKGVCAVARDFDADGRDTHVDFFRAVSALLAAGYRGYVGIAYQGERLGEMEGIGATKALLEAARRVNQSH